MLSFLFLCVCLFFCFVFFRQLINLKTFDLHEQEVEDGILPLEYTVCYTFDVPLVIAPDICVLTKVCPWEG